MNLWSTGAPGQPGDTLPLGPAMLAWSFNRDFEAKPGLIERRDQRLRVDTAQKRRVRAELQALARPQSGVDDLRAAFPHSRPIAGVVDRQDETHAPKAAQ